MRDARLALGRTKEGLLGRTTRAKGIATILILRELGDCRSRNLPHLKRFLIHMWSWIVVKFPMLMKAAYISAEANF